MKSKSSRISHDIVIVGQQPWDIGIGSNCKNIALELSKTNRVLYVNSPLDRITLLKNSQDDKVKKRISVIKGYSSGIVEIQSNLWNLYPNCIVESINWISSTRMFSLLNKLNNKRFANSVAKALYELGFKDYILFNDNEIFKAFYLKEYLKPFLSIYYSRDYMLGVDYWKKHGDKLEPILIAKSDICFANSEYLSDYCKLYNQHSYNVGQGCDIDMFTNFKLKEVNELDNIEVPLIGYVGALNSERLDIDIIYHIATQNRDWTLVLVGPEDDEFKKSKLHSESNVIFLGQQDVNDLPNIINKFDVCINPQSVNPITIGNYPRKVDEYLALGKPVVATRTKTMEAFESYVYLADSKEEYCTLITLALSENSAILQEQRREFAALHTWENSVKEMTLKISEFIAAGNN